MRGQKHLLRSTWPIRGLTDKSDGSQGFWVPLDVFVVRVGADRRVEVPAAGPRTFVGAPYSWKILWGQVAPSCLRLYLGTLMAFGTSLHPTLVKLGNRQRHARWS